MKKYISFIFIFLFFLIFSMFFWEDYFKFHEKTISITNSDNNSKNLISNFDLSKIQEIENVEIYYTPYKELKDKIIDKINNAKNNVYIEVYIFTQKDIRQSLINAKKRWLDVKVILEKNPYNAYNINNTTYNLLKENWIDVVWSNAINYSLNHTKFFVIDDEVIISTWNISQSSFYYNRDFYIFIDDENILNSITAIFNWDYLWQALNIYNDNLLLSPFYSRDKFETLFDSSKESIKMYFQYFKDDELLQRLIDRSKQWIKIQAVLPDSALDSNKDELDKLEENWIEIKIIKKPVVHSKIIIIDDKYLFVWSINFSSYSLDKNREVWIIVKNKSIIDKVNSIFYEDFLN